LANQQEFVNPDTLALTLARNQLHANFNTVRQAAQRCYANIKDCDLPEIGNVEIALPERHGTVAAFCENPIYETRADPLCGPARFKSDRGQVCGAELHKTGTAEVCGVASFKNGQGEVCGVDQYAQGKGPQCGGEDLTQIYYTADMS
jgi:hypothetical protein